MNKTEAMDFDRFVRSFLQGRDPGPLSAMLIEVAAELFQRERERVQPPRSPEQPLTRTEAA